MLKALLCLHLAGIDKLQFQPNGDISGMVSAEGELVPLKTRIKPSAVACPPLGEKESVHSDASSYGTDFCPSSGAKPLRFIRPMRTQTNDLVLGGSYGRRDQAAFE